MPPASPPRQPEPAASSWFEGRQAVALQQQVQHQAIPELTRVFGHSGLFLRPAAATPAQLSGNMLARVVSLHRSAAGLSGDLLCRDEEIPLATSSLALAYALFVLETSRDAEALVGEIARTLKPEGVLLVVTLNPLSPFRVRWAFSGLRAWSDPAVAALLRQGGLEVRRQRSLGPLWSARPGEAGFGRDDSRWLSPLRAATLTIAKRRDPAMNPMRQSSPGIRLHTGVSPG
jgi:SAM-dependent methyltransferase